MKKFRSFVLVVSVCAAPFAALAYPMVVHSTITEIAAKNSVLASDPTVLARLHLKAIDDVSQQFATSAADSNETDSPDFVGCAHGSSYTILGIMQCGAEFEDSPGERSFNHFDDWQGGGAGLNVLGISLGKPSPVWIAAPTGSISTQKFSYGDAEKYYFLALTSTAESDRKSNWGLTFQSLGQSVHHIQDMAQPQHVRNDAHCDDIVCLAFLQYNPSRYEAYTFDHIPLMRSFALRSDGNSIYPGLPIEKLQDFWDGPQGMAAYTSANYVSAGTNFAVDDTGHTTRPSEVSPEPIWPIVGGQPIQNLYPNNNIPGYITSFCAAGYVDCNVASVDTIHVKNEASLSIFDGDLKLFVPKGIDNTSQNPPGHYNTTRVFSLNSSNYLVAATDLVPLASAFSSGIVNFFFRGVLAISPPDRGAYGYLDMSDSSCASGACGFKQLKMKVLNSNSREQTSLGSVYVVAKYHVNSCFKSDFSMQYNTPGVGTGCRSSDEKISVSAELQNQSISSGTPLPLTFDFSANPIPISATDLYIQVIYRGNLGSEVGTGIAVGELDISEPSGYELENNDDYSIFIQTCSPFSGTISPGSIGTGMSLSYSLQFSSDPASVTSGTLARGERSKFAFLTDSNGFSMFITSDKGDSNIGVSLGGDVEQLDKNGALIPTSMYKNRGGWVAGNNAFIWDFTTIQEGSSCLIAPLAYESLYPAYTSPLKPMQLVF